MKAYSPWAHVRPETYSAYESPGDAGTTIAADRDMREPMGAARAPAGLTVYGNSAITDTEREDLGHRLREGSGGKLSNKEIGAIIDGWYDDDGELPQWISPEQARTVLPILGQHSQERIEAERAAAQDPRSFSISGAPETYSAYDDARDADGVIDPRQNMRGGGLKVQQTGDRAKISSPWMGVNKDRGSGYDIVAEEQAPMKDGRRRVSIQQRYR